MAQGHTTEASLFFIRWKGILYLYCNRRYNKARFTSNRKEQMALPRVTGGQTE